MVDHLITCGILLVLYLGCVKYPANIAHYLNNFFNLPHPGPNSPKGACSCREYEGKNKYTFLDCLSEDDDS